MTALASVSVCMATYNGAAYVEEQLRSILEQLGPSDEVVVADDCSTDDTVRRIRDLNDSRLRVIETDVNAGYARRFEQAIEAAQGEHIFLADQDDVWAAGRVRAMQESLGRHLVVAGNLDRLGGGDVRPAGTFGAWRLTARQEKRRLWMIAKLAASQAPYYGSAMAIRRDALPVVLPFPQSARELHDGWLALIGLISGSIGHVEEVVVHRRVHDSNTTGRLRSLRRIALGRILFLQMCAIAFWRVRRSRH